MIHPCFKESRQRLCLTSIEKACPYFKTILHTRLIQLLTLFFTDIYSFERNKKFNLRGYKIYYHLLFFFYLRAFSFSFLTSKRKTENIMKRKKKHLAASKCSEYSDVYGSRQCGACILKRRIIVYKVSKIVWENTQLYFFLFGVVLPMQNA